jgi:hypothetical protein
MQTVQPEVFAGCIDDFLYYHCLKSSQAAKLSMLQSVGQASTPAAGLQTRFSCGYAALWGRLSTRAGLAAPLPQDPIPTRHSSVKAWVRHSRGERFRLLEAGVDATRRTGVLPHNFGTQYQ